MGSMGPAFSLVTGNTIHDIHARKLFTGAEMAGIKFHGAVDVEISRNHIYRTVRGIWMDWMAQGTRVSANLFHDNTAEDVFFEVDHGPFLVDNNILLSKTSLLDVSEGGAYAHNLFTGRIVTVEEPTRLTPYHPAHSTRVAGLIATRGGDNRFFSNLFVGSGEGAVEQPAPDDRHRRTVGYGPAVYDIRPLPSLAGGNVYFAGAKPLASEADADVRIGLDPGVELVEEAGTLYLRLMAGPELASPTTRLVTTKLLGTPLVAQVPYENADGSPLVLDKDFFGKPRDREHPTPGPFERPGSGPLKLRLR